MSRDSFSAQARQNFEDACARVKRLQSVQSTELMGRTSFQVQKSRVRLSGEKKERKKAAWL